MKNATPLLFQQRHILPEGRMLLRIVTEEQKDIIKYAAENGGYIAISMLDDENTPSPADIATRSQIIDYLYGNGVLNVIVQGQDCVRVTSIEENEHGILLAKGVAQPTWPAQEINVHTRPLAEKLQSMFDRYPELSQLYSEMEFENLSWLCQRWLELLPLPPSEKQRLMSSQTCAQTTDYLISLMQPPH
ncbi:LON peptidase substrate-binding domain-containing protein [Parasalinivibrio latis]|uniref:LON peptidase substrate-binding domain-containing protein n=1 Tax=Parasalinivibrio latis TaxID=2952610 RepID=UPI0030E0BDFD